MKQLKYYKYEGLNCHHCRRSHYDGHGNGTCPIEFKKGAHEKKFVNPGETNLICRYFEKILPKESAENIENSIL